MSKSQVIFCAAVVCCLSLARLSPAQTTLRWKLQAGEKLQVEVKQQTTSVVSYAGKSTTTQIDVEMELDWQVIATEKSTIRVKQTLRRLTADVATQDGGRLSFDSATSTRPSGQARDLAAAMSPIVGAELEIEMNQRGEVIEVKPANKAAEILISQDDAAQQSKAAKHAIQQLLKQPLMVLPESFVRPDDTWTTESELDTALGKAKHKTTYRFTGVEERDGRKLERIESSTTLGIEGNAPDARKLRIKEHQQTGTLWFDSAAGRLDSAEQSQKLVTERPYRDTTIVVTLESKQQTKVSKP
jgi:hypothetical protein